MSNRQTESLIKLLENLQDIPNVVVIGGALALTGLLVFRTRSISSRQTGPGVQESHNGDSLTVTEIDPVLDPVIGPMGQEEESSVPLEEQDTTLDNVQETKTAESNPESDFEFESKFESFPEPEATLIVPSSTREIAENISDIVPPWLWKIILDSGSHARNFAPEYEGILYIFGFFLAVYAMNEFSNGRIHSEFPGRADLSKNQILKFIIETGQKLGLVINGNK